MRRKSSRVTRPEQLQVTRIPPGFEQFHAQAVQAVISAQGMVDRQAAAGEAGRIEDYGAEPFACDAEGFELGERFAHFELHVVQSVLLGVELGLVDGLAGCRRRPALRGHRPVGLPSG